ncbi:MAG: hypothetical protein ACR652_07645 [Methylocystis sp.]|uniref:hypothetical protein n=1 Tax=Methylocystis sp. TaxID=1911079 RepID=UPI003DA61C40
MAVKTIETRAKITAEDRTGATFASVAQKLRQMEGAAAGASRRMDGIARAMSSVGQSKMLHEDIAQRMSSSLNMTTAAVAASVGANRTRLSETARVVGERLVGATITTGALAGATVPFVAKISKDAADQVHERIKMESSGMTGPEIADAFSEAGKLSREFKPIAQNDILHMLRNARSIVGTYEEAAQIMEPMLKLRTIAQFNRPSENVNEDFDQLVKGLEIKGVTQDLPKLKEYLNGIAKALNVFGDTLKPYQYYEMFKYGRQATPGLSEHFILSTAPTLAQELGGSSYGKAVSAFNAAIVGGVMKHSALKDFVSLGLADQKDLLFTKTGEAKGFKPGAHMQGWQLAQSDPNEWVKQFYLPSLAKAGVTSKEDILARISQDFQNQTAAQMVGLLATQQPRITKDAALIEGAKGLDAAYTQMTQDLGQATQGLKNQFDALSATLGKDVTPKLTGIVDWASEKLGILNKDLTEDPHKRTQTLIGGGLLAGLGTHFGLASLGGYFGGAGLGASLGAFANTMGPVALAADLGALGYKLTENYRKLSAMLDETDKLFQVPKPIAEMTAPAKSERAGILNFGLGGPVMQQTPVAKLEGAARIAVDVRVAPAPGFSIFATSTTSTEGALSPDTGVSMPPTQ